MSDSFFGTTQQTTTRPSDVTFQSLFGTRQGVINQVLAGAIPSPDYLNKIVIPSTMNTLTMSGLGRTGAVGEAVSKATLGAGLQLLETLLTGIPAPGGSTQTTSQRAGLQDILGLAGGGLQGLGQFIGGIGGLGALGGAAGTGISSLWDWITGGGGTGGGGSFPDILRGTAGGDIPFDISTILSPDFADVGFGTTALDVLGL